jgi:hypothetical protein
LQQAISEHQPQLDNPPAAVFTPQQKEQLNYEDQYLPESRFHPAIAIPNFVRARQTSQTNACINNLRQIDGAKQQELLEDGNAALLTVASLSPYLGRGAGSWPECPQDPDNDGTDYTIGAAAVPPLCAVNGGAHILP